MKVLFVGGTGFISTAVSRQMIAAGVDLTLLHRSAHPGSMPGARHLTADIDDRAAVDRVLGNERFDVAVDWIVFTPAHVDRDIAIFRGRVKQFVHISTAAVYQKPPTTYRITESTPLANPYWTYASNKIACEMRLMQAYREEGFPVTVVRPNLTYDPNFPIAIGGWGCYTLADRLKRGQPIIVHGDGTSLFVVTHAEDFARGFIGLLGNDQTIGHAFHITTDEVLNWNQIYAGLADALGVEAHVVHIPSDFIARVAPETGAGLLGDKSWSAVFDNSKIKAFVPGFQAIIPYREGIRRTLAWFAADPRRQRVEAAVNAEMDGILAAYDQASAQR
jgi:nucleoside-diphosphate-sugar epimerase